MVSVLSEYMYLCELREKLFIEYFSTLISLGHYEFDNLLGGALYLIYLIGAVCGTTPISSAC